MKKFYCEKPADKYGNRSLTACVIEGEMITREGKRPELMIHAPAEVAAKWPSVLADCYGGFVEVEGPARLLTMEEQFALAGGPKE